MTLWINIAIIVFFTILGGVFSCSEMALISLRESQLEQMEQKDARGARVGKIARDPNRFLSTVQIGVTVSGFLSASFGASAITPYVIPLLEKAGMSESMSSTLSMVLLTVIISFFSIVVSELAPKRIALQRSESIARSVVPAIDVFSKICKPLIWLIGKSTNGIVRLAGLDPHGSKSEVSDDELRMLVSTNSNLSADERTILDDVFGASTTTVAEVMRPRADVTFIDGDMLLDEAAQFVSDKPYSRYPVIGKDFDEVLGFVHVRDILGAKEKKKNVEDVTRAGISLPGTSKILPSMSLLREKGIHLAVVIDEYGGTDGIVTLEDMTEQLVGDIRDEYDIGDRTEHIRPDKIFKDGVAVIDAGMTIGDFAELTGIELPDGPYETVAGYVMAKTGTMGYEGEILHSDDGYDMVVTKVDRRRIETIEVRKTENGKTVREKSEEKSEETA